MVPINDHAVYRAPANCIIFPFFFIVSDALRYSRDKNVVSLFAYLRISSIFDARFRIPFANLMDPGTTRLSNTFHILFFVTYAENVVEYCNEDDAHSQK